MIGVSHLGDDIEIHSRIAKSSCALGALQRSAFMDKNLTLITKRKKANYA